jgi:hypothetical protein
MKLVGIRVKELRFLVERKPQRLLTVGQELIFEMVHGSDSPPR